MKKKVIKQKKKQSFLGLFLEAWGMWMVFFGVLLMAFCSLWRMNEVHIVITASLVSIAGFLLTVLGDKE